MKRLELLDYGRFLAAIIVILFHYTFNGIVNGKISSIEHSSAIIDFTKYGYLGVELFFMISGYVIFFRQEPGRPPNLPWAERLGYIHHIGLRCCLPRCLRCSGVAI